MENTKKNIELKLAPWESWSREDSEELVRMYLMDYFQTLDDYYLEEALQIAKDDGVNFEKIMRQVRFRQA